MDQLQKQRESESNITEIPGNETIAPTKCEKERQPRQIETERDTIIDDQGRCLHVVAMALRKALIYSGLRVI